MTLPRFAYVWRFTINPNLRTEFLAGYHPHGEWAQLFSLDPGYIKTELLQDDANPDQYVTVDYWASKSARDAFQVQYAKEFAELDLKCEAYTLYEEFIGDFILVEQTNPDL